MILNEDRKEFAEFLRFMRKSIQLNQHKMAKILNMRPERISRYERGLNIPQGEKRMALETHIRQVVKEEFFRRRQSENQVQLTIQLSSKETSCI